VCDKTIVDRATHTLDQEDIERKYHHWRKDKRTKAIARQTFSEYLYSWEKKERKWKDRKYTLLLPHIILNPTEDLRCVSFHFMCNNLDSLVVWDCMMGRLEPRSESQFDFLRE